MPRFPRADVIASVAGVGQHLAAAIINSDGIFLTDRWSLIENGVERAVFFSTFLNEMEILAIRAGDAHDAQIGEQHEFEHAFTRDQRRKRNGGAAEQMTILGDHGFDVVAMGSKEPAV